MKKLTTCLWFDGNAEDAVNFYLSVFKDSKLGQVARYGKSGPGQDGTILIMMFEVNGQPFMALNGGPMFKFSPATSFVVNCDTQAEIDYYWDTLSAGGKPSQCGWLDDKFGVTWQIVPSILGELMSGDAAKSERVMVALQKMIKLDIAVLREAAENA